MAAFRQGPTRAWAGVGVICVGLLVSACNRQAATNPNAPGSPGRNPTESVQPQAPDGPPGGSSGVKGGMPAPGSSGGDMRPGSTGTGAPVEGENRPLAAPGTGLHGGFPDRPASATAPAEGNQGSSNRTTRGSFGN